MLNNQLESLESVAYAKLADFIQSERLSEAAYLVDIICRIPNLAKSDNKSLLTSMMNERRLATGNSFKENDYELPSNYGSAYISNTVKAGIQRDGSTDRIFCPRDTSPQTALGKVTLDGYAGSLPVAVKPSEYTWNDGSKDPREDYWRDG